MMIFVLLISAYLLGSIPSGLLIGKVFFNKDIRNFGSGNLGATNSFRVLGKKAGIAVTILDIAKGAIAVLLPVFLGTDVIDPIYLGILAVIGHVFPIFAGFRGGKAVATSCGVILAYNPYLFLLIIVVFVLCLKLTKYVSLSSMAAAVSGFLYSLVSFIWFSGGWQLLALLAVLSVFILIRHRTNIIRIREKTEPKVTWI